MNELGWKQWLQKGRQYEKAGTGKDGKPSKLPPTVVYNMFSMSLENYCMAILDYHGTLPDNHTFTDLMDALDNVSPLDAPLKQRVLELEKCQQICSFDDFVVAQVDAIVNREFQDVVGIIGKIAHAECNVMAA